MTSRRTGESPTAAPRPRPSPPSVHRQAPGGPHTGTRHRVGTGGRRHRHRERPTRVPATRAAADPKPSPVPIQSRLVNVALRTQVRRPGQRTHAISLNLPPVMQRWVGGHHATVAVPTGLMTPEDGGRSKEAGESGSRFIPNLPYLISDLPEIHMHALPTAISKGVTLRHSVGLAWRPRGRDPTPDDWISRPDGRPASSNLSVRNCRVGLGQMTSRRTGESPTAAPRPRPSPPSVHRQAPGGPHTTAAKRPARQAPA
jgi:hypothetical protein